MICQHCREFVTLVDNRWRHSGTGFAFCDLEAKDNVETATPTFGE